MPKHQPLAESIRFSNNARLSPEIVLLSSAVLYEVAACFRMAIWVAPVSFSATPHHASPTSSCLPVSFAAAKSSAAAAVIGDLCP